ncbi:helix-turn-helix domain-containing protein [Amycolatopsis cynarae]|uniref:Helix-turn-helix domain-containing protein n=1 Tax=Amycolatopsis cynarae TaxID=2995223 RepID=A0ABY7B8Q6_9PSEU|nr:helix-turn-helix domain-containing protein [Amycolatopsis sp. HUAS 11-8]WAL67794.1 helix-turn-helix domain-containing protein [Amycolatopsis sp. HUAS 11-8]
MRLIEDETAAVFNVGELARHLGVTVRALELGFRRALDETPHEYLRRIRLGRAHRELVAADAYGVTPSVSLKASPAEEATRCRRDA